VILYNNYKKKYLLNKVLNNNAYLSYIFLKDRSLSLASRQDVNNFKDFILKHARAGKILDIGCGPLDLPGYLDFPDKKNYEFYGLDPIESNSFKGFRVTGCAEFMPFEDSYFDTIIFATSLDHVCSLEKTILETYRVLSENGKVIIWLGDKSTTIRQRLTKKIKNMIKSIKEGYRVDKYFIYPNLTVFYIPDGAQDSYHTIISDPKKTIKMMKKANFELEELDYRNKNEVFISFKKK